MQRETLVGLTEAGLANLMGAGSRKRGDVRRTMRARRRAAERERRQAAKVFQMETGRRVPSMFDGREICEGDEVLIEAEIAASNDLMRLVTQFALIDFKWELR